MKLADGQNYTLKELTAMYLCMHLETSVVNGIEIVDENTKKNKRIFTIASKLVGGRKNLDSITERFVNTTKATFEKFGKDL